VVEGTRPFQCKRTQEGLESPVSSRSSNQTKGLNKKVERGLNLPHQAPKKQVDKRFKADQGESDVPRFFKCEGTDHLLSDCREASPEDRTRKGNLTVITRSIQERGACGFDLLGE
jgi:hypothetical protein